MIYLKEKTMTERIKLKNLTGTPTKGMYITQKDRNSLIIAAAVIAALYGFIVNFKYVFRYVVPKKLLSKILK